MGTNRASAARSGRSRGTSSFPSARLISISQAETALTATRPSGSSIAARVSSRSARSPVRTQIRTCVSSRSLRLVVLAVEKLLDLQVRLFRVPVGREPHLALPGAELSRLLLLDIRNELRHGPSRLGDYDLFALRNPLEQAREVRFRLVCIDLDHFGLA